MNLQDPRAEFFADGYNYARIEGHCRVVAVIFGLFNMLF